MSLTWFWDSLASPIFDLFAICFPIKIDFYFSVPDFGNPQLEQSNSIFEINSLQFGQSESSIFNT
jgi:hypothetical protein